MRKLILIVLFSFILSVFYSLEAQEIICKLKGTIVNRPSDTILLLRETDDIRYEDGVKIPIHNNSFKYNLKVPCTEKFLFMFQDNRDAGRYKRIYFFPENCTINFTLHSNDSMKMDVISGGELNYKMAEYEKHRDDLFSPQYMPYRKALDSLSRTGKYFSNKGNELHEKISNTNDKLEELRLYQEEEELLRNGELYSREAQYFTNKRDSVYRLMNKWSNNYLATNIDIFSYSLLLRSVELYEDDKKNTDLEFISTIYPVFAERFPSHPYTTRLGEILKAIYTVKVGGHYIDFTSPTIDGKMVKVSEIIQGKVALLDFWASWCGSCRVLSKSVIPVYEKYKDKGFIILGVAGEFKNTDAFSVAMAKDKYPWLNLIELDHQANLWNKYNIGKQGGNTFLVDSNGIIISIHPNAEELDKILSSLLRGEMNN
jgi:thiol-disulfide isomerase/thioredoxin